MSAGSQIQMAPQSTVNSGQSVHSQDSNMSTGKYLLFFFSYVSLSLYLLVRLFILITVSSRIHFDSSRFTKEFVSARALSASFKNTWDKFSELSVCQNLQAVLSLLIWAQPRFRQTFDRPKEGVTWTFLRINNLIIVCLSPSNNKRSLFAGRLPIVLISLPGFISISPSFHSLYSLLFFP